MTGNDDTSPLWVSYFYLSIFFIYYLLLGLVFIAPVGLLLAWMVSPERGNIGWIFVGLCISVYSFSILFMLYFRTILAFRLFMVFDNSAASILSLVFNTILHVVK